MSMDKELTRLRLSQTNRPIDTIVHWFERDRLLLDAPYQRGDVWGNRRRVNLIRSILLNIPIPSIIINDRFSAGWGEKLAVIDGKQRITSLLMFLTDKLPAPGGWFGLESDTIVFSQLPPNRQRRIENHPIAFSEGQLASVDEEQEVFDLVNFGGLAQGEQDTPTGEENE